MRILHIVPTYWPAVRYGGPIRTVHALCRGLVRLGHDVQVFTTNVDGTATSPVPIGEPVDLDGVRVTYFSSQFLRRLYWSPTMGDALKRSITSFDLVHLHSVFLWPTWAAARASRRSDVPYVLSPRGMLVPELIRRRSRWVKSAWIALIERHNLAAAAAIHATSRLEAEDLVRLGWPLPHVEVIPNGVDDPLDPVEAKSGGAISHDVQEAISGGPMILSLGRISWKKGLDRLVAALPFAPAARLVVVGNDDEGHAAILTREAVRLGVAGRLAVLPRHVDGADKEALFGAAQLFAMPSLSENFGLAAVEAMRRGLPVLVTAGVGAADIVRDSGGGLVVSGEPSAIAAGLNSMLTAPISARAMGEAGRSHVIAHLGWNAVAHQMERLYASILTSRRSEI